MANSSRYELIIEAKDKASAALKQVQGELRETGKTADGVFRDVNGRFLTMGEAAKLVGKEIGGIKVTAEELSGSAKNAASSLGGVHTKLLAIGAAVGGVYAIKSAFDALVGNVFQVGRQFEDFETRLNALTKGQGTSTLAALNEWARSMPVNTQTAIDAFAMMQAMGLDPTLERMTTLVDVSVNLGEQALPSVARALGQMAAKGKISAEEILQLSEAGVNATGYLRDAFGMSVEEIQKSGIAVEDVIDAIFSGLNEQFGGSAAEAMTKFSGLLEAVKSEWTEFLRAIGDAGVMDFAKEKLKEILDIIEQMKADGSLRELTQDLADGIIAIGKLADSIVKAVIEVTKFASEYSELLLVVGGTAATVPIVLRLSSAITGLGTALKGVTAAQAVNGVASLGSAAATTGISITGAFSALGTFVAGLNPVTVALGIGAASVFMFGEAFKTAQKNIDNAGQSIDQLNKYNELAMENARKTKENFEKLRKKLAEASDETKVWNDEIAKIKDTWELQDLKVFEEQIHDITNAYHKLKDSGASELEMGQFLDSAREKVQKLLDQVAAASPQVAAALERMLPSGLQQKVDALRGAFEGLGITSSEAAKEAADKWISEYELIANSAESSAGDQQRALDALVAKLLELKDEIPEAFEDAYGKVPDIVKEAVDKSIDELKRLQKEKEDAEKDTASDDKKRERPERSKDRPRSGWAGRSGSESGSREEIFYPDGTIRNLPPPKLGERRTWARGAGEVGHIDPNKSGAFSEKSDNKLKNNELNINTDRAKKDIEEVAELADKAVEKERTLRVKVVTEGDVEVLGEGKAGSAPLPGRGVTGFAAGGSVFQRLVSPYISQGSGLRDDVPAMLMRGEYVVRKAAVSKYGTGLLEAINSGRLPLDVIPRFASGGLVLPPQIVDLVPRFAKGGAVKSRESGSGWGLPFSSASDILQKYGARSIDELLARYASTIASTASRIRLPEITDTPAAYLSSALGVVADSLEVFRANDVDAPQKIASGDSATAALERQKLAISGEYENKIAIVRREGNESLAILLEQERLELVAVVQELQSAIEELVEAYRMEVEAVALEAEEEMRGLSDEFDAEYEEIWELSKKIGGGTGTGNVHQIHVHQTAAKKEAALRKRYERLLARVERSAGREITGQYRLLERDVKSEGRDATAQGVDSEATARLDLRATYGDFLTRIQELEIEKAQALRDLEEKYGTLSISGFKHWLASGGLVGGLVGGKAGVREFAAGGHVPLNIGTPGKDSVAAMLMPGEYVVKRDTVRALGLQTLERLNGLDARLLHSLRPALRFADGGLVPGAASSLPVASSSADTENFGTLTLNINGSPYEVRAKRSTARGLRNEIARMARSSR